MTKEKFIELSSKCPVCTSKTEVVGKDTKDSVFIGAVCPYCSWSATIKITY